MCFKKIYIDNNNDEITSFHSDDFSDEVDEEVGLEMTNSHNGKTYTQKYSVPYTSSQYNRKRLLCYSFLNNDYCNYGNHCTYAHGFNDQVIDYERKYIYQITFDKDLMDFFSITNPKTDEIYPYLLFNTQLCKNCMSKRCTGGYNCKHGVFHSSLKLCKNDLLTGQCLNKVIELEIEPDVINKIENITKVDKYMGCINGHHLTERGLVPYYKYIHKKEDTRKNKYQSVRYIDINSVDRLLRKQYNNSFDSADDESEETTDEEINSWFRKDYDWSSSDNGSDEENN